MQIAILLNELIRNRAIKLEKFLIASSSVKKIRKRLRRVLTFLGKIFYGGSVKSSGS
jgi:hypothetical protein